MTAQARARRWGTRLLAPACAVGFVACEIADRNITEEANAGSAGLGASGSGAEASGGSAAGRAGGGKATGGDPVGGRANGGDTNGGSEAGGPSHGGAGHGGTGEGGAAAGAGAGGEGVDPKVCAIACAAPTPVCEEGTCVAPKSCAGLAEECGSSLNGTCCNTFQVPSGTFKRSYDGVYHLQITYPASVSSFALDALEVTVGRFRRFVQAGFGNQKSPPVLGAGAVQGVPASGRKSTWNEELTADKVALVAALGCNASMQTWTNVAGAFENRPVGCVTWYEAQAFCIWDGGRLPSEAEWNYAASGGNMHRVYPWSDPPNGTAISPAEASYFLPGSDQCFGDGVAGCTRDDLVVVGRKGGAGAWGHRDLGGNVLEWVLDSTGAYQETCTDCVQTTASSARVLRGGGYNTPALGLTASYREEGLAIDRAAGIGFRCAYGR